MKTVIQGEREIFLIKLVTKNNTSGITENIDISGALGPTSMVCFKAGTTVVSKTFDGAEVTVTDGVKGELSATMLVADTETFKLAEIVFLRHLFMDEKCRADGTHNLVVRRYNNLGFKLLFQRFHHRPVKGNTALKHDWRPYIFTQANVIKVVSHQCLT